MHPIDPQLRRLRTPLLIVLLWPSLFSVGCGPDLSETSTQECETLIEGEHYETAAIRCQQTFAQFQEPRAALAMARALNGLGRPEEALGWIDRLAGSPQEAKALGLAARIHLQAGEPRLAEGDFRRQLEIYGTTGDEASKANAYYGLFYLAWQASDFQPALEHAQRSFAAAQAAGDRTAAARALRAIFSLHYDLGDLQRAAQALEEAEPWIDADDALGRARFLSLQGALHLDRQRAALARGVLRQALDLAKDATIAGDTIVGDSFYRSNYINLVRASLALDDLDAARNYQAAAERYQDPAGPSSALLYFRARLGLESGDPSAAKRALQEALAAEPTEDWAWDLELLLGTTEERMGNATAAAEAYGRSIEILEGMRARLDLDELKVWLLERKRQPYEALFRLQAEHGQLRPALATVEKAKARAFLDAFLSEPQNQVETAETTVASLDIPRLAEARQAMVAGLLPSLHASPLLAGRRVDDLLNTLAGRQALIYFRVDGDYWLLRAVDGRLEAGQIETAGEDIDRLVSRFLARPGDRQLGSQLATVLLPAEALAREGRQAQEPWILVPDGSLAQLPFAALSFGEDYLVKRHAIQIVPSLSALRAIEERRRGVEGPVVVLGDPRGDLPAAAAEAQDVARRLGSQFLVGASARRQAMPSAAEGSLLHLATHTGVGPQGPWLELAEGRLDAALVLEQKLGARLVVLASCASGAPRGQGLWGSLGATFLAAGSDTVLVALWSIDDATTRRFMDRFYAEDGAEDPVLALARTQRAWIQAGEEVASWAPFTIIGSATKAAENH